ncbi:LPS-assembly protein LptD, partial [bacterium]|nr:LPS-assembly protein LptD [bacterium]
MTLKPRLEFYCLAVLFVSPLFVCAQEAAVDSIFSIDSAITAKVMKKNLWLDSLRKAAADTVKTEEGLDTLIFYGADTTEGTLDQSTVILKNNAWVKYRGMEIKAAKIIINQPLKLMTAEAIPDSLDSLGQVVRYKGIPEFSEGGESFTGNKMEYNLETRRGRVVMGETKMQDGIYYGENIRKIGENTLYIRQGRFTTCEEKDPHFFFQSKEMKLIVKDKVVAKPVILYIHEVPILAIPFGVFPNRSGRASGITPPAYSETPREGRQIRNFGYFWAPNDYFDALGQVDFLDKAGFLLHGGTRYAKRYSYTGNFQFSYSSLSYITGQKSRLWNIDASHSQTITDKQNLNADIHYVSSKNFYQNTSVNQQQILNRQIRTNISYNNTQDWGSFSANLSQSENLDNGQKDFTFPNVTINKSNSAFFPKPEKDKNKPDTWYQSIRYGYSSNLLGRQSQASRTADPASALGMNHNVGISAPFKILKYFNVNPSLNLQETWFDRRSENFYYDSLNHPVSDTVRSFFARHTFS